jgi:hypothetical protein
MEQMRKKRTVHRILTGKPVIIIRRFPESKERLRIQPAQVFHCTRSVARCVQESVDSYLAVNDLQMMRTYSILSWTG